MSIIENDLSLRILIIKILQIFSWTSRKFISKLIIRLYFSFPAECIAKMLTHDCVNRLVLKMNDHDSSGEYVRRMNEFKIPIDCLDFYFERLNYFGISWKMAMKNRLPIN